MFDREGYVRLARLWRDFEGKYLHLCQARALELLMVEMQPSNLGFGTVLDLCEDVFLSTFDKLELSIVPLQGYVFNVEPTLPNTGARLLLKLSAFESVHVSTFEDEAGQDGKWLKQMGSSAFCAADIGYLWPSEKGRRDDDDFKKFLLANAFNTLPVLYERPAFVIARERPPWSYDLLEDSYVRNIWNETRGSAICLPKASIKAWEATVTQQYVETTLRNLVFENSEIEEPQNRSKGGRPQKLGSVVRAYMELGLAEKNLTREEELRLLEEHISVTVSLTTLGRVRRSVRKN